MKKDYFLTKEDRIMFYTTYSNVINISANHIATNIDLIIYSSRMMLCDFKQTFNKKDIYDIHISKNDDLLNAMVEFKYCHADKDGKEIIRTSKVKISKFFTKNVELGIEKFKIASKINDNEYASKNIKTNEIVEILVNSFKEILANSNAIKENYEFQIVKGDYIKKYYLADNASNRGTLGASCMRYPSCQIYFDLYTKNSNCSLLILKSKIEDKIIGRSLLWNAKVFAENEYNILLMDKVYYENRSVESLFYEWANNNLYYYYIYNNSIGWHNDSKDDKIAKIMNEGTIYIEANGYKFAPNDYPYLDNFQYLYSIINGENIDFLLTDREDINQEKYKDYCFFGSLDSTNGECHCDEDDDDYSWDDY